MTQKQNGDAKAKTTQQRQALPRATASGKPRKAEITRMALIEAAERLIAKKGLANVTTREILEEAGQKNQSALQYHFGSKDGLIGATINERTSQIDRVRVEMLDNIAGSPTMQDIYEALVYPLRDLIKNDAAGQNYLSFLAQAMTRPTWDLRKIIEENNITGMKRCYIHFDKLLSHLSEEERLARQNAAFFTTILTLKRWCSDRPTSSMSLDDVTKFTIDMSVAIVNC